MIWVVVNCLIGNNKVLGILSELLDTEKIDGSFC